MNLSEQSTKSKTQVIFITGEIGCGKTTLLEQVVTKHGGRYSLCGFTSTGKDRNSLAGIPSNSYRIKLSTRQNLLDWARRDPDSLKFSFSDRTAQIVKEDILAELSTNKMDVCYIDEIGKLELNDGGHADLFREVLDSDVPVVIATVRKSILTEIISKFNIYNPTIIDLDFISTKKAFASIKAIISTIDANRIGVFSGIAGLVEVGLGSMLHAYRVPFKGHFLSYFQSLMLIEFGKSMNGRGLVRISFIAAMLKTFSPMGKVLMPVFYIFTQGCVFSVPIALIGWNLAAVIMGGILMSWYTLGLSLAIDYLMFGRSIFDAYAQAIELIQRWTGFETLSLLTVLITLFGIKALIAVIIASNGWFVGVHNLLDKITGPGRGKLLIRAISVTNDKPKTFIQSAYKAMIDLFTLRFILFFFVSILLISFFTKIANSDLLAIAIRALCISYLGFLLIRRANVTAIGDWLDRRFNLGLGKSLPVALKVLTRKEEGRNTEV